MRKFRVKPPTLLGIPNVDSMVFTPFAIRNGFMTTNTRDLKHRIDCSFQLFTINYIVNRMILQVSYAIKPLQADRP